ncbi:hypothetical protein FOS14_08710 [Skermania sp. ID1734]|uniref:hypothetical protein n=1 Tax=Skermania sp. ID1734 TaxID=2597516 RepID=UPI00117C3706|nr:hypothetical protein [Skermania sp. ID1734]TSD99913.1 hypothetical protein FOS14_08710 [Skermania sp. ID1734]
MTDVRIYFGTAIFAALTILGAIGAASIARAEPVDPNNGPGKGCPIVQDDANGNTTVVGYAHPGDRQGVLVCGKDGEWSFGKAVTPGGGVIQRANPPSAAVQ